MVHHYAPGQHRIKQYSRSFNIIVYIVQRELTSCLDSLANSLGGVFM